ncbi:hypothetical protein GCM10022393_32370 [Aquimarina addita]|uniref:histidine kinase n=1 Tax=Aquimarina addita TaxID=870485 RepID=A0ABP6URQ1_9FLAO
MIHKTLLYLILLSLTLSVSSCGEEARVLNSSEKKWLKDKDHITVAVFPYYPPYQFINESDNIDGILIEYLHLIEKKVNYTFEKKYYSDWNALLKDSKGKKVDIVLEMQETNYKRKYMNFYANFFESSFVLVVKKENNTNTKLNDFTKNKTIAVPKGYAIDDYLRENYPNINIKNYPDDITCLVNLQSGEVDGFIGPKAVVNYIITMNNFNDIKIVSKTHYNYEPSIAVDKDNKILNSIIHKSVNSISEEEESNIFDNWNFNVVKPFYKKSKFWKFLSLAILCILLSVSAIHFFLKYKINQKTIELQIAKEKAEKSSRMKTNFIQNISHEIRTPMNGIIGFSDLLKTDDITVEEQKEFTQIIVNSSNELITSVQNILEISGLESKHIKVRIEKTNLNNLLKELILFYTSKAQKKKLTIHHENDINSQQSLILVDKVKIKSILNNLIDNAIKFTNYGNIIIYSYIEDEKIIISIKDTGIGIKKDDQHIIFESFSQSEKEISKNFGGLGLGLSISKMNSELINGKISFFSKENKGSQFTLTIPYTPIEDA